MVDLDISTLLAAMIPLGILIYWLTDLVKDIKAGDVNAVVTKVVSVGIAFLVVTAYAHSSIEFGGDAGKAAHGAISSLSWLDALMLATMFAATAGTGSDVLRTFNNSDGSVKKTLL